ncbi:hypothetical protein AB0D08_35285 [Kitasatospora sp. NPDC048540]|uniref:hypothetical protein n=1 Tax=Kitasatospora sp. NPDC048540 TaxID=3155634 RepID=UPI0033F7C26A
MADSKQDLDYFKHNGSSSGSGGGGGGSVKHPKEFGGDTSVAAGHGHYDTSSGFTAPTVPPPPGKAGTGTTVSTASLDRFADNIASLIAPVEAAKKALRPVGVHPGNFYHASAIQQKVNGLDEDAGLKGECLAALTDLGHALGDLHDGVKKLSGQYKTIEDANKMTAKDLHQAVAGATGKFNTFIDDAGGDPASGPAGGPAGGAGDGGSQGTGGGRPGTGGSAGGAAGAGHTTGKHD